MWGVAFERRMCNTLVRVAERVAFLSKRFLFCVDVHNFVNLSGNIQIAIPYLFFYFLKSVKDENVDFRTSLLFWLGEIYNCMETVVTRPYFMPQLSLFLLLTSVPALANFKVNHLCLPIVTFRCFTSCQ